MIALGFDPGLATTGYGIVQKKGSRLQYIGHGVIRTTSSKSVEKRLNTIYESARKLIEHYSPDVIAVEKLYFEKNVTNGLLVAQARGVLLLASAQAGRVVAEFSPTEVKTALVGYGRAEKCQVQSMVQRLLFLNTPPKPDDSADALALAICSLQSYPLRNKTFIDQE